MHIYAFNGLQVEYLMILLLYSPAAVDNISAFLGIVKCVGLGAEMHFVFTTALREVNVIIWCSACYR